jgi:hypothetical protein
LKSLMFLSPRKFFMSNMAVERLYDNWLISKQAVRKSGQ